MSTQAPARPFVIMRLWRWLKALDRPVQLALGLVACGLLTGAGVFVYQRLTAWPVQVEIRSLSHAGHALAFSSDGKTLATDGEGITLWNTATGAARRYCATPRDFLATHGAFAPDGKLLAVAGQLRSYLSGMPNPNPITIRMLDVQSGQLVVEVVTTDSSIENLSFSEDGRAVRAVLSTLRRSWKLLAWDAHDGAVISTRPLLLPTEPVRQAVFSHDGQTMAFATRGPDLTLWDLTNGRVRCVLKPQVPPTSPSDHISFSTDDAMLALGREDGSVEIWDLVTRQLRKILKGHAAAFDPGYVEFSPDGKTLVSLGGGRTVPGLRLVRARIEHFFHARQSGIVELVLWDIDSGRMVARVEDEFLGPFSPDGRMLVTQPFYEGNVLRIREIPQVHR